MKRFIAPFLVALVIFGAGFVLLDYLAFGLQGLELIFEG